MALAAILSAGRINPNEVQVRAFKGAFCIPNVFEDIPYGDHRRIWTPAYGCYDDTWRARIRAEYAKRGYTHFVYNWCGLPYGADYPELAREPQRARRDLSELRAAGFIPVVALTDDRSGVDIGYALSFVAELGDVLKFCGAFPRWEQNESLGVDVWDGQQWVGENTRFCSAFGDAFTQIGALVHPYVHFTPEHGSGGDREPEWWHDVTTDTIPWLSPQTGARGTTRPAGVRGLLSQDNHWDDAQRTAHGLQTTAMRLNPALGKQAGLGWPFVDADVVNFECQTTVLYRGRTEPQGIDFNTAILNTADSGYNRLTGVAGFCDSGHPV